jgi:hypothetical protein
MGMNVGLQPELEPLWGVMRLRVLNQLREAC